MAPEIAGASAETEQGGLKWPLQKNTLVVVFDQPEEAQNFLKTPWCRSPKAVGSSTARSTPCSATTPASSPSGATSRC